MITWIEPKMKFLGWKIGWNFIFKFGKVRKHNSDKFLKAELAGETASSGHRIASHPQTGESQC